MTTTTEAQILQAGRELIGSHSMSLDSIMQYGIEGLKKSFRQKAYQFHPDRAHSTGQDSIVLQERFKSINEAYQLLIAFIKKGGKATTQTRPSSPYASTTNKSKSTTQQSSPHTARSTHQRTQNHTTTRDHFWHGSLPKRALPLGQYLYYSKLISWQTMVLALAHQKQNRPNFGMLARRIHLLTENQIQHLRRARKTGEKIGETALRLGYLTNWQRDEVLQTQKKSQLPVGHYFVQQQVMTAGQLANAVTQQRIHNRKYGE